MPADLQFLLLILIFLILVDNLRYQKTITSRIKSRKKPGAAFAARAFQIITPQMPFRWISRSLSVTGGRPPPERLTSN